MKTNALYCSICTLDLYRRYSRSRDYFHKKCSTCVNSSELELRLCKFCRHLRLQHFFQCDIPPWQRSGHSLWITLTFDPDNPCIIDRAILKAVAAHHDRPILYREAKSNGTAVLSMSIAIEFRGGRNDDSRAIDIYAQVPPSDGSNSIRGLEPIFLLKIVHKTSWRTIQNYGAEGLPRLIIPSPFYTSIKMSWRGYVSRSHLVNNEPGVISEAIPPSVSWETAREWLSTCRSEHAACRRRPDVSFPQDMLLIDVKRRRLVDTRPRYRFVTLSYVWGPASDKTYVETKRSNREVSTSFAYFPKNRRGNRDP
jgi:hypothetical protein